MIEQLQAVFLRPSAARACSILQAEGNCSTTGRASPTRAATGASWRWRLRSWAGPLWCSWTSPAQVHAAHSAMMCCMQTALHCAVRHEPTVHRALQHCADRIVRQVLRWTPGQIMHSRWPHQRRGSKLKVVACASAGMDPGARHFLWGILQRQVIAAGGWQASRMSVATCLKWLHCSVEKLCHAGSCLLLAV
jgi:hypothetical protein